MTPLLLPLPLPLPLLAAPRALRGRMGCEGANTSEGLLSAGVELAAAADTSVSWSRNERARTIGVAMSGWLPLWEPPKRNGRP